jgi:hypothetical protein
MEKSTGLLSGFFNIWVIPSNLKKGIESGCHRSTMKVREQRVRLCWRATGALPRTVARAEGRAPLAGAPLSFVLLPWQWF